MGISLARLEFKNPQASVMVANTQVEARDLPEIQVIFRLRRSAALEKMAALDSGVYGILPYRDLSLWCND